MGQSLMKKTAIYSLLFSGAALGAIFYLIDGRAAVKEDIAQEEVQQFAQEEIEHNNEADHNAGKEIAGVGEETSLTFELGSADTNYLCVPLPGGTAADSVTIENHYMDNEMWIAVRGGTADFYKTTAISGNQQHITEGIYEQVPNGVLIKLSLKNIYECRSILENNKLYIEFMNPRELYDRIVVIDPAFGGSMTGHESGGLKEKEITLAIAEKLKEKLDNTDIKVYYTRMDDNNPTEEQRVKIANNTKADMLIRIEANADDDSMVHGTTAVYNENFFIPGFGSVELANVLEKEVVSIIKGKAVGLTAAVNEDYVVREATVPAAAIKVGYLTNAQEAILLQKEDYIDKIAAGIYQAIETIYKGQEE